jgi:hypothetical protein
MITFQTLNGVTLVFNNDECVNVLTVATLDGQPAVCIGSGRKARIVRGSLNSIKARLVRAAA